MTVFGTSKFNAPGRFAGVAFDDDGGLLASFFGARGGVVRFDSAGEVTWSHELDKPALRIASVTGGYLVFGGDGVLCRTTHDETRWQLDIGGNDGCVSRDERYFAVVSYDGKAHVGDVASGNVAFVAEEAQGDIFTVAFSVDGAQLATGSSKGVIRLYDVDSGTALAAGRATKVLALAFEPGGDRLVSGHGNGEVRLWELPTLKKVRGVLGKHEFERGGNAGVRACHWAPDGTVFTIGNERAVRAWHPDTGELHNTILHDGHAQGGALDVSPDGCRLAAGDVDGALTVWSSNESDSTVPPRPAVTSTRRAGRPTSHSPTHMSSCRARAASLSSDAMVVASAPGSSDFRPPPSSLGLTNNGSASSTIEFTLRVIRPTWATP